MILSKRFATNLVCVKDFLWSSLSPFGSGIYTGRQDVLLCKRNWIVLNREAKPPLQIYLIPVYPWCIVWFQILRLFYRSIWSVLTRMWSGTMDWVYVVFIKTSISWETNLCLLIADPLLVFSFMKRRGLHPYDFSMCNHVVSQRIYQNYFTGLKILAVSYN